MHIKEFRIYRYGPLTDSDRIILGDFNLLYGLNEEGKSLTIDAIVRLILAKKAIKNIFKRIDRVDDKAEGYIILEDDGNTIKFPDDGDITNFLDLSSEDLRNIFIIRNSDLSISKEETFYTGVTDKLTGLKSNKILLTKRRLMDIGKLTRPDSNGKLSDREADEKLLSRKNRAESLIDEIENLKVRAEEEGLDKIEEKIEDLNEDLQRIKMEFSNLEDAEKREKYEKGIEALEGLKSSLKKLKVLEVFNEDEEKKFRDKERDIQNTNEEMEKLAIDVKSRKIELEKVKKVKEEDERELHLMSERKRKVEDVEVDIKRHEECSEKLVQVRTMTKSIKPLMVVSVILLALSIIGMIVGPLLIFSIFSLLFFIPLIYTFTQVLRLSRMIANHKKMFERIRLDLVPIDISSDSMEDILSQIQVFKEKYYERENKLQSIKSNEGILIREMEQMNKKNSEYKVKIREFEKVIEEIKNVSRVKNLGEYQQKFIGKQEVERVSREHLAVLKSLFGTEGYSAKEELLEYWDKAVLELEIYRDKALAIRYNDREKRELHEKRDEVEMNKFEVEKKYINWQDNLKQIERESQEILKSEVYCNTLKEMSYLHKNLKDFVYSVEKNVENVLCVMRIFEDIEKEEETKISKLFGKDSRVSKYFSRITNKRYRIVDINTEEKHVFVYTGDNKRLDASKLSGGTYDQLYLSIRLALGGELLNTGFFIMDDPFVKSDFKRLQTQMHVLRKIVDEGWQILYFTAKKEVKDVLKKDIDDKKVKLIETNWITL